MRSRLGPTELMVSPWCLGCNSFGWTTDARQSFDVLDAYVAHGGNFLDTADVYPPGTPGRTSEEFLGRWLRERGDRDDLVLATKVGGPVPGVPGDMSAASVRRRFEASLKRLQVDHVDLLYAHLDDRDVPLEESLGALDELVRAGTARHIAASNFTKERLEEALELSRRDRLARYVALQTHYNLLERHRIMGARVNLAQEYEGELARACVENEIGVVAYWVLAKGFLTGKYRPGDGIDEGADFSDRAKTHRPREYMDDRGVAVLAVLDEVAEAHGTSVAAVAMAWTLAQPGITANVVSARTPEQVAELAVSLELELDAAEVARLSAASELEPRAETGSGR